MGCLCRAGCVTQRKTLLCTHQHNLTLNSHKWNKSEDYFTLVILRYMIQTTMLNNSEIDIVDYMESIFSTYVACVCLRLKMRLFKDCNTRPYV